MLTILRIKNLALVADLTLEVQPGYNAITGETGAGKSIIMGALNLVLGERADRTLIRSGSESCSVEAVFSTANLKAPLNQFLDENGLEPCEDNQLVLKRTFSASGANRQFINGSPTSLGVLSSIGQGLVDIHGPHDHQSLLYPARQLAILDAFAGLQSAREQFGSLVRSRNALEAEKTSLIVDEKTYAQQLDSLRFQSEEIKAAKLHPDEEGQLEQEYHRASNSAKLLQLVQAASGILSEDENAILSQAGTLGKTLHELQRLDPSCSTFTDLHDQIISLLNELQEELSSYTDKVDVDPARLQELEERITLIHSLKRKYGSTLAEVIQFGEQARQKLKNLEQRDEELERINKELEKINSQIWKAGQALSAERKKAIPKLCKSVTKELSDLGFKQSRFEVELRTESNPASLKATVSSSGLDTVEFQFAPNPGEPVRSLRAIASSGEMARVMLALKTVLASEDEIPVLVFDEVDANVGGETANAVGRKMRQIARKRQVLCITHLAPVAAHATAHFVVNKQVKGGRTVSEINLLQSKERVEELARMLGGQSEAARQHAEALLKENAES